MNTAVADELLARNPCHLKGAGIEHAPERPMLDTSMVLRLADVIEPRLRSLVLLGGFVGLRPGELLGLQRRDIDLLHGFVQVRRQAQEISGHGRILVPPKSEAGTRSLALPSAIAEELRMHLDEYAAPGVEGAVVTRLTGRPLRRADLSLSWQTACAGAGLKGVRVHDLRHHAATLIARNREVTLKELMATIGHSSPVAALRYQHATQERSKAIANYVDSVISRERETPQVAVVRFRS